jgi:hypothetical protein
VHENKTKDLTQTMPKLCFHVQVGMKIKQGLKKTAQVFFEWFSWPGNP